MPDSFRDIQFKFTAHLRDPVANPAPQDIEDRRMGIYRDLFYKNIENFIANGFPVLREIYDNESWHALVRDFFSRHQCQSPYFLEIGEEFIAYLQNERDLSQDPPYIIELAHYEWVELGLDVAEEEIPSKGFNPTGDMLGGRPCLSPLAWVLQYQWPVHKIAPDFQPEEPSGPYYLIVYRNRDYQISFMEVNALTARLINILQENELFTGMQGIEQIASEMGQEVSDPLIQGGKEALEHLRQVEIVLGTSLSTVN